MTNSHVLNNRQTEPCSSSSLASTFIDAVETLGEPRYMLWLNPLPLISYGQGWIARIELPLDRNQVVITTVLQCIHHQITHGTVKLGCIAENDIVVL